MWDRDNEANKELMGCNLVNHEIAGISAWQIKPKVTVTQSPTLCLFFKGKVSIAGISLEPHPIAITLRSAALFKMSSRRAVSVGASMSDRTAPEHNEC